ncbi:MAG: ABC transporter ATP-binding protein [Nocardioides sp.]|uniref:ABC transporter ATP-binding protein n=1 Tax=Nocardioides sp. TaxID=35761 RepID=UPI003D0EF0E4
MADVSVEVAPGVTGVLGPNGAGKTSLLRVLATDLRPQRGKVQFDGRPVDSRRTVRHYRRAVGFLPQRPDWHKWMTVREAVAYFAWLRAVPRNARSEAVGNSIEMVGLSRRAENRLGELSGGMFQRAMLATTLVHQPEVLILDEPTAGLDPVQRHQFREIVRLRPASSVTLISTHVFEDVTNLATNIVVMHDGRLPFTGTIREFTDQLNPDGGSSAEALEAAYLRFVGTDDVG